ncbi:polysialic acid transport protein KpsD [Rhodovarius crocodyli]|uniref:Polysialic acid transport protein KpsD n=1 Tax=Rhodovarius crocodyli TaxID=1979269 RepID=A0A437MNY7_9PROT|nr:polysaccharide biosynthesis/export family protein [Rhodovarius crocodyli]RVT99358.1 polysialic acid transport protein KpsD [Rhodovarius crocodyli]
MLRNKLLMAAALTAALLPALVHAQPAQDLAPGRAEAGARQTNRVGSATEAEAGAQAVLPLGAGQRNPGPATAVFGSALFTNNATATSDAPNPNYVITPGDRVSVRVWGATEAEVTGQVDSAGMLFLPQIGPVRLAGTRAGDLQRTVEGEVRRIYTQEVNVYAVLLSTQRIGVFVTGFVKTPGRFGGSAADSVIDFLVRAGGVDPSRGSYRDIVVRRNGANVASVDLYNFLIEGRLPALRLQEGDTIVVGRQRALVGADGAVRNNFLFEVPGRAMTGRELVEYSRPLPAATNAVIQGSRGGRPFSRYVTLGELSSAQLGDQDTVSFITDAPARTIRVTIEGSRIGPSVLVADRDTQLCTLLDYVAVDPSLANTQGVFLLRQRVAAQQQRTMEETLDRLERQLFLATSPTTGVSQIRTAEANLVGQYIQRARRTRPDGLVVVMDSTGNCAPVRLEDGDVIVIPERSQTILVSGEVNAPRAILWQQNLVPADYIRQAGGLSPRGNTSSLMIRRASGELVLDATQPLRPGDELIALPHLDRRVIQLFTDFSSIVFQLAYAARSLQNF